MSKCEVCGTQDLPDEGSACSRFDGCMVCEDCLCKFCDAGQFCAKHCMCICLHCDVDIDETFCEMPDCPTCEDCVCDCKTCKENDIYVCYKHCNANDYV